MASLSAVKQEQVKGYPLSTWIAAFGDGIVPEVPSDPDGSLAWREGRCPANMTSEVFGRLVSQAQPPFDLVNHIDNPNPMGWII
jgi:hypothetical protein